MDNMQKRSFLDSLPSKTAFIGGFIAAILVLGTVGFIILGSCVLKGDCGGLGLAQEKDSGSNVAAAPSPTPSPAPSAEPVGDIPDVTDADHIRGDKNAPLTLIEYSDFECPFCSRFHPTAKQVVDEYPGKVRWVYRHFPLSFHAEAEPAAVAAECAGEQGKFFEYADLLFENQSSLGDELYKKLATQLGLNTGNFNTCLTSGKFDEKIKTDTAGGAAAGVTGTPGSFILDNDGNVVPVKGALPFSSIKQIVDSML